VDKVLLPLLAPVLALPSSCVRLPLRSALGIATGRGWISTGRNIESAFAPVVGSCVAGPTAASKGICGAGVDIDDNAGAGAGPDECTADVCDDACDGNGHAAILSDEIGAPRFQTPNDWPRNIKSAGSQRELPRSVQCNPPHHTHGWKAILMPRHSTVVRPSRDFKHFV